LKSNIIYLIDLSKSDNEENNQEDDNQENNIENNNQESNQREKKFFIKISVAGSRAPKTKEYAYIVKN
jgi:hypothetical protein